MAVCYNPRFDQGLSVSEGTDPAFTWSRRPDV